MAPPAPITCRRCGSRSRMAHKFERVVGSTMATEASACCMRYSSASGPKRCDSGSAIAPIWKRAREGTAGSVLGDLPAKAVVELGVAVHHGLDFSLHEPRSPAVAP